MSMGCPKITYYQEGEGLEKSTVHFLGGLEEKKFASKFCDSYLPFGLTFNHPDVSEDNKYLFQGQELQNELDLGWYSFKWRNHDPAIGRFFNVDPIAEDYYYNSPYVFSENKVVAHIELEGLEAFSIKFLKWVVDKAVKKAENKMDEANLSPQEKKVVRKNYYAGYKSRKNYIKAYNMSNALVYKGLIKGPRSGVGNALRHSLWSALNVQTSSEDFAREIGIAHEEGSPDKDPKQKKIDLENNELGITVGLENPDASLEDLTKILLEKIADGEALVIDLIDNTVTKSKLDSKDKAKDAVDDTYISDDHISDDGDGPN